MVDLEKDFPEGALYGVVAQFGSADELIHAAEKVRDAGYKKIDAYSPYPVEELLEALGKPPSKLPWLIFMGGTIGFLTAVALQFGTNAFDYPINIGGRPLNSWPAYIPIEFELTVLLSAVTAVFGTIILSGLPRPYHPLFNVKEFASASVDGFFLSVEAADPLFEMNKTKTFLSGLQARGVYEVQS